MVYVPILDVKLFRRDVTTGNYDTIGRAVGSTISADVRVGIDSIRDVFSIQLPNKYLSDGVWSQSLTKRDDAANTFQIGDLIQISAYYDTPDSNPNNNVLLFGELTDFSYTNDNDTSILNLTGNNITESLLKGFTLASKKIDDLNADVPNIIIEVVNRLNQSGMPAAKKIYAAKTNQYHQISGVVSGIPFSVSNLTGSYGNIAATRSTGASFGSVTYSKTWQPVYKILEDLGTPEYTGETNVGNYINYVKATPVLDEHKWKVQTPFIYEIVFQPPSTASVGTLTRGVDYISNTIKKDVNEVKTVLIIKPGTDPRGTGITTFVVNSDALSKYGPKFGYWNKPEIANAIKKDERISGSSAGSVFTGDIPGSFPYRCGTIFERQTSYPYDNLTGSNKIASSADAYNTIVRNEIRYRGKIDGQKVLDTLGEPRYSGTISLLVGSNNYSMGTIVGIKDDTIGWDNTASNPVYKLRIRDIQHRIDDGGWITNLNVVEDEKVISEQING